MDLVRFFFTVSQREQHIGSDMQTIQTEDMEEPVALLWRQQGRKTR